MASEPWILAIAGRLWPQNALVIVAMALTAVGATCFVVIAERVSDRHTQRFDESVLRSLRQADNPAVPAGPACMGKVARDVIALGSLTNSRWTRAYMLLAAGAIPFLVGISRTVLGVHYPTDMLAGWLGGTVWALCCWLVARRLRGTFVPDRMNGA